MSDGWLGLIGVAVGVLGTLGTTWMVTAGTTRQNKEAQRQVRQDKVRELAATAYVDAVDAVQWLSSMHVEDSVDPDFAAEYGPKTQRAVTSLAAAQKSLTQVVALGGSADLATVASDTVTALGMLGDSWERCQEYRRRVVAAAGKPSPMTERRFDEEYARLNSAREALCGTAAALPWREIDEGVVKEGSLLSRLRSATARFD